MSQNLDRYQALLLNADGRPLSFQPVKTLGWKEAVQAVMTNRVNVLDEYPIIVRSPGGPKNKATEMFLPSVVSLTHYQDLGKKVAFTRLGVYLRDRFCCQYCEKRFVMRDLTFDHVIPSSKGGRTVWENITTACMTCNLRKGCSTAEQKGMRLISQPYVPTRHQLNAIAAEFPQNFARMPKSWLPYLGIEMPVEMAEETAGDISANPMSPFPGDMTSADYWNVELEE